MKRTVVSLAALVALAPVVAVAAAAPAAVRAQAPSATEVPVTTTTTTVPPTTTSKPKVVVPERRTAEATIVGPTTTKAPAPAPRQTQTKQQAPAPQGDPWMSKYNQLKGSLPGNYVIADKGSWGATNLSTGTVYIARRTPLGYLDDVMKHEAIHVMQGRVYGGISNARAQLNPYGGIEAVADCGARMLGATWTHYVSGCTSKMNHAARAMLNGVPA